MPAKNPLNAAAQRLRRWRKSPLLLKRLPGGSRIFVIKRIDPTSYRLLSDQDIITAFHSLVKANKWDQK